MKPPKAKMIPKVLEIHGDKRIDNYYWLNQREDQEVIDYLNAENDYTEAMMAHTKELQEELFNEIVGRIKQTDMSVPYFDNGYHYYTRFEEGKEYALYCRKKGSLKQPEEVMMDVNIMAKGYDFYQVGGMAVSDNNELLAYGVDTVSRRMYTIHVKDLKTGNLLSDEIPNTTGSIAWASDHQTFFYTVKDPETLRSYKIMRHKLGTDPAEDEVVFTETDEIYTTYVYRSKSRKYIMIASNATLSTEYRYLDAAHPGGKFEVVLPREKEHEYYAYHYKDHFYILSNDQARNFKLVKAPIGKFAREHWEEVIAHRTDVLLENIEIFKQYLVVDERQDGLTQLRIIRWDDFSSHYLDFGEPTYSAYISINPEFDTEKLRYAYSSLTTPNSTFDYHMSTKEKTLLKQQEVIGDFKPEDYQSERLYTKAKDGTRIPISLVYRKGLQKDQSNPVLLYGYGSYGYSMDASFSSVRLSLLDRGFVYAIAHIRGGQEMGRYWYDDGKMLKKINTFTDFIACGEHIIEAKFTTSDQLMAMGGSAGGLLMGAVINMRPDLFKGAVAAVPFVDVVTTMLDESIPLTTGEYDEWGNPNEPEYYHYIKSYSPYDNVEAKDYPNLLVTTGLHDSQVQYWEPAKWVAKLREMKTDDNLLLLKTDMSTGHGGKSGRFERYRETALEYAFLLNLVNPEK